MFIPHFLAVSIECKAIRTKVHSILYHLMVFIKRHLLKLHLSNGRPLQLFHRPTGFYSSGTTANVDP